MFTRAMQNLAISAVLLIWSGSGVQANPTSTGCLPDEEKLVRVRNINITPHPIFDESLPETGRFHRLANALHTTTRPFIIKERLPFREGDEVTAADLAEAEALLRKQRYLANAEVRIEPGCDSETEKDIAVTTQDNWSLIPTISFSRSGGNNKSILGVRDDNVLGLGVRGRIRYNRDVQRTGFELSLASAVHYIQHATLSLELADNDDGEQFSITYDKPFYHLATKRSHFVSLSLSSRVEDIYQNDRVRNSLDIESDYFSAGYGWQLGGNEHLAQRLRIGFTADKNTFTIDPTSPSDDPLYRPVDRDFRTLWMSYEYTERAIQVMQNVYYISQPEDINLGWQYQLYAGLELNQVKSGPAGYRVSGSVSKTYALDKHLWMLSADANAFINMLPDNLLRLNWQGEYFYHFSPAITLYSRLSGTLTNGFFDDMPVVVDDDNGVRGYPIQYQHGERRVSMSIEGRLYPKINVYQLFEVGFAAYFDIGRASGGATASQNEDEGVLSSVGIGARLYSNKASTPGVVHIDISRPLGDGESVNSWEWSAQLRRSF